jgi:hypothetical protein
MVRKNEEVLLWGYCGVGGRTAYGCNVWMLLSG